ncbi:hypothetical protein RBWH47_02419 [Rhodopirellula baltica WH47]|uniref:Uncharacterized protein n=2 Tax=Rhodopirellula baltica TaxID=265606 RepID=F2B0V9_RHOBT|nr:hypothetical protein RBWH47_02419 [Rhodopirellula baltica WH47]ELP29807.1 hypothetical protein RBSWK_06268 [Rhodopirellula baltica SWK14]
MDLGQKWPTDNQINKSDREDIPSGEASNPRVNSPSWQKHRRHPLPLHHDPQRILRSAPRSS